MVARWWRPLAAAIAAAHAAAGRPIVVGINGPQGSGKSTLCLFLEELLAEAHGLRAATLSLDDLYLTRAERAALAARDSPLLATRGVPGTHDVALGHATLDALTGGRGIVAVPRFDKAVDDRAPANDWSAVPAPVDVTLFEGWCVGAAPQAEAALAEPVNALEAREDADRRWRATANAALAGPYAGLFARLDLLVMLAPPGFAQVRAWRTLQEEKLRARTGRGMDAAALERFVQHYERLTRAMLADLPARADIVVPIDADHLPTGLRFKQPRG